MSSSGVLYLDFDGVLHPSQVFRRRGGGLHLPVHFQERGHRLFEHAGLLVELLEPYPDVGVILSTSWVRVLGYDKARSHLPADLASKVVGATYHSRMQYGRPEFEQMSRGQQVLADVERRRPGAWLAVDDDGELWPATHLEKLVLSHPDAGISGPSVRQGLEEALAREFGRV